jgi:hypothetical protein
VQANHTFSGPSVQHLAELSRFGTPNALEGKLNPMAPGAAMTSFPIFVVANGIRPRRFRRNTSDITGVHVCAVRLFCQ